MILSGRKVHQEWIDKRICITPFSPDNVTTNSYDLTLGDRFVRYTEEVIDPSRPNEYEEFRVGSEGVRMEKGDFLLGHSVEVIGSDHYVPIVHAKSSIARLGLFVHITADLIDIGSHGNVTFQLYNCLPITLYPGMTIGQISFWQPAGEIVLYKGKYQGSHGPRPSECYKDFAKHKSPRS